MGAGDGPSVILMTGTRSNGTVRYPVSALAARYGASADEETTDPEQAYAGFELGRWARPPSWSSLPWALPE